LVHRRVGELFIEGGARRHRRARIGDDADQTVAKAEAMSQTESAARADAAARRRTTEKSVASANQKPT
jgi:hypothetical protein